MRNSRTYRARASGRADTPYGPSPCLLAAEGVTGEIRTWADSGVSPNRETTGATSMFDHDKTVFPLKGGHENVACSACHTVKRPVNGVSVLFYKPTPTACSDCHGSEIPKVSPFTQ